MTHEQMESILNDVFAKHGFHHSNYPDEKPIGIVQKSIKKITDSIARRYGMSSQDLRGPRGSKTTSQARDEIYRNSYQEGYTLDEIGQYLGNRHHTTVLAGIRRAEGAL